MYEKRSFIQLNYLHILLLMNSLSSFKFSAIFVKVLTSCLTISIRYFSTINQTNNFYKMKNMTKIIFTTILAMMIVNFSFSQVDPSSAEYQSMKEKGLIEQPQQVVPAEPITPILPVETGERFNGLFVPLDGSFTGPLSYCDDCYFGPFTLPFTFCFYGTNYNQFYINNNGNVSFEGGYGSYSSTGFPVNGFGMLAPFWADVDTRNGLGGVYYKIEPTRVTVIWDNTGYFSIQGDKRNTFELIFTNGNDPLIGVGKNVAFSYADMQWTTGSASGGVNGFGGIPATVGVNKGDGVKYALVGRFDHEGTDYDGPGGIADGVSYLDGKYYSFNACSEDVIVVPDVPVSNWALFIGIGLILAFAIIRFRKVL